METNFNEIQQEILRRAKEASACKTEYSRAYAAENLSELSQVIKDNFDWACAYGILTVDLIEQYKEDFAANGIYVNQNVKNGYLLCNNATVEACGNSKVEAYCNAKVEAYDSATVKAYCNATVEAYDNATVKAYDDATVKAYDSTTVEAYDSTTVEAYCSATVEAYGSATVKAYHSTTVMVCDNATVKAYNNVTVKACDSTTVEAHDNSYCTSLYTIAYKLFDHAIYRVRNTNTVYYADSDIKFVKK